MGENVGVAHSPGSLLFLGSVLSGQMTFSHLRAFECHFLETCGSSVCFLVLFRSHS